MTWGTSNCKARARGRAAPPTRTTRVGVDGRTAHLDVVAGLGCTGRDRYLLALPLFHVTGLGMAMAHMHAGGASVLVARFDAEEAVRLIDRHRVTHLSDFPPVLSSVLDA